MVLPLAHAQGDKPTVQGYLFYSQTCLTCPQVRTEILPRLYKEFGQQLQIKAIDTSSDPDNQQWFLDCADKYGVPQEQADLPTLFVGDEYMVGVD
jgi:hypothetical protein